MKSSILAAGLVLIGFLAVPVVPAATPFPLTDAVERLYEGLGLDLGDRTQVMRTERALEAQVPGLPAAAARIILIGLDPNSSPQDLVEASLAVTRLVQVPDARSATSVEPTYVDPFHLIAIGTAEASNRYIGNTLPNIPGGIPRPFQVLTIDMGGNDEYVNSAGGAITVPTLPNPRAASFSVSIDLFSNKIGDDTYDCTSWDCTMPAQGAAKGAATGILIDMGGNDAYSARPDACYCYWYDDPDVVAQGAAVDGASAYLFDRSGDDTYDVVRGLAYVRNAGTAVFQDTFGDDAYDVIQGLATVVSGPSPAPGLASFLDAGVGRDSYSMVVYSQCSYYEARCLRQSAAGVALAIADNCSTVRPDVCPDIEAHFLDDGGADRYQFPHDRPAFGYGTLQAAATFLDLGGVDAYSYHATPVRDVTQVGASPYVGNNAYWSQNAVLSSNNPGGIGFDSDVILDRSSPVHAALDRFFGDEDPRIDWCIVAVIGQNPFVVIDHDGLPPLSADEEEPEECRDVD